VNLNSLTKINLIDFGASRSYSKAFVDKYIRIIHAAAHNDRQGVIKWSRETGFLTGYETKVKLENDRIHLEGVNIEKQNQIIGI
jgi:predicted unusual protein kinase regulating ubiquinone biosynthesis (AarF/ABC1/UbiB family)